MVSDMKICEANMACSSDSSSFSGDSWLQQGSCDEDSLQDISFLANYTFNDLIKTNLDPVVKKTNSPYIVRIGAPNQSSRTSNESSILPDLPVADYGGSRVNPELSFQGIASETTREVKGKHYLDGENSESVSFLAEASKNDGQTHISAKESFKCEICHKEYAKLSYLTCHIKTHSRPKPFKCDICKQTFPWMSRLIQHKKKIHSGERPYNCRICKQTFNDKYNRARHEKIHSNMPGYKCNLCDKSFMDKNYLITTHMKSHNRNELYTCEFCNHTFSKKANYRYHMRFVHKMEFANKCGVCDETFYDDASMREHIRMRCTNGVKYKCQVCNRTFLNVCRLNKHRVATHTVGFAFGCDLCEKTFYEQCYLMSHRKSHFQKIC